MTEPGYYVGVSLSRRFSLFGRAMWPQKVACFPGTRESASNSLQKTKGKIRNSKDDCIAY